MQWLSLWSWVGAPVASASVFQTAAAQLCRAGCPLPVGSAAGLVLGRDWESPGRETGKHQHFSDGCC